MSIIPVIPCGSAGSRLRAVSRESHPLHLTERDPEAALPVLAADHLIADQEAFATAVQHAAGRAREGKLVTFGILPDAPETGYGYIEAESNAVLRFVEKPDAATAQTYLESSRFYWNSGMFCFTARTMLEEIEQQCPAILAAVRESLAQSRTAEDKGFSQCELEPDSFRKIPEDSIDYAVMESPAAAPSPSSRATSAGATSVRGRQSDANRPAQRGEPVCAFK